MIHKPPNNIKNLPLETPTHETHSCKDFEIIKKCTFYCCRNLEKITCENDHVQI